MEICCDRLSREEQRELVIRSRYGDKDAQDKLIMSCYGLVKSIAARFWKSGVEYGDLLNMGVEVLLRSISKFDITKNSSFSTYAATSIYRSLLKNAKRERCYAKKVVMDIESDILPENSVCHEQEATIRILCNQLLNQLNDFEREIVCLYFGIGCPRHTLVEIGKIYNLSKQRIHQIKNRAIRKLSKFALKYKVDKFECLSA